MYRFKHLKSDIYTYWPWFFFEPFQLTIKPTWSISADIVGCKVHGAKASLIGLRGGCRRLGLCHCLQADDGIDTAAVVIGFCFFPTGVVLKLCKYNIYIWYVSSRCICQSSLCVQMHIIYIHLNLYESMNVSCYSDTPTSQLKSPNLWTTRSCARVVCHDGRLHRTGRRLEMLHKKFVLVPRWTE